MSYSKRPLTFVCDNLRVTMSTPRLIDAPEKAPPIGLRVHALREAMGLSLRELSERSGVSAPMLSQVERGETSPTLARRRAGSPPGWS